MHDSNGGNTLRGIFLISLTAFLIFAAFIFGFHLVNPNIMNVEPEVITFEYFFYHPEIIKDIPAEDTENDISEESIESSSDTSDSFWEWWMKFSALGMLLSSCICLICVSYARHQSNYNAE